MGSAWFVSSAILPSDLVLICNVLWPSVPTIEDVWFMTRSVSVSLAVVRWIRGALWPSCLLFYNEFGRSRKHVALCCGGTTHELFKYDDTKSVCLSPWSVICILHSNSWHLDDKLTLFGVALQSMNLIYFAYKRQWLLNAISLCD